MKAYTLKKKIDSNENHLFEGEFTTDKKCNSNFMSVCKKMNIKDSERNVFTCNNELEARNQIAEIGRNVCGICVSHLYETY